MQDMYKIMCKDILKKYYSVRGTIGDISLQIEEINGRLTSTTARYGIDPVQGGGNGVEENYLNNLAKKALLEKNNEDNIKLVEDVEEALKVLSEKEEDIVLTLFASGKRGMAEKLAEKYHYDKSYIYRIADDGLKRISYKLFGDA